MRILLTTDTIGGVWTFTRELCSSLCGGNDVALVSFGRPLSAAQDRWVRGMRTVQDPFFTFHASDAPLEWMSNNDRTFDEGATLLRKVAKDFQPDLLHSNQFCWGALADELRIPVVLTAHSDVLSWARACRPAGLEPSQWLDRYRHLVQSGLDSAAAVTAPTQWMLDALAANFHLPSRQQVIFNGTDVYEPEAIRKNPPQRKLQAITAGRLWDEGKNIAMLSRIDSPMPILIAGESTAPGEQPKPQPAGRVQHLGPLDPDALHQAFRESALYVCPSLYEPFGLAPLEAALCGCALLLNDLPSLHEVWGQAATYFASPVELEQHLNHFASNSRALKSAQAQARGRAAELSTRRMTHDYRNLYNQLVSTKQSAGALAHAY